MKLMSLIVSDLQAVDLLYEKIIDRISVGIGIFEILGAETTATEFPDGLSVPLRIIDGNPSFYLFFSAKRTEVLGKDLRVLVEQAFPSEPSVKNLLHTLGAVVKGEGEERIVQALGATIRILVVPRGLGALLIEGPRSFAIQP
jgi:hypothetical protein